MSEFEVERIRKMVAEDINSRLNKIMYAIWAGVISFTATAVAVAVQWGVMTNKVETNIAEDIRHHANTDLHMTTSMKLQTFVSRQEFTDLRSTIIRIEDKLDKRAGSGG